MLGLFDINPYIPMGNWGTYHQKACKGGNPPEPGQGTTEKCNCNDSVSSSSLTGNATLYLHNTTITATGGLEAIATITATNSGSPHNGPITDITSTTLTKTGGMQTGTSLQAGDILTLTGGPASANETQIEGTIIVTKAGSLGGSITLNGRLAGTLTLSDGGGNNITVNKGPRLEANPDLKGITITGGLSGTATMTITTTKHEHDLRGITGQNFTIRDIKLTKGIVESLEDDGGELKVETDLQAGDTLNLIGTASAAGITGLTVSGTIKITGSGGNLEDGLTFGGDVTRELQFQDAEDGVKVKNSGTLTLSANTLTVLQNTNFSLTSDNKRALTYKPIFVTKSTITIGTIAGTSGKVTLSGLSLIPVCIDGNSGLKATANLTLTHTKASATNLKEPTGLSIDLTSGLNNSTVTITKINVKNLSGNLQTTTPLDIGDTLNLNITPKSSTNTTLSGTITVTGPGKLTGELTLKGGLTGTIRDLSGNGELTGSVSITDLKYDPMEFHVNHQDTLCCYWGGKNTRPLFSTTL